MQVLEQAAKNRLSQRDLECSPVNSPVSHTDTSSDIIFCIA